MDVAQGHYDGLICIGVEQRVCCVIYAMQLGGAIQWALLARWEVVEGTRGSQAVRLDVSNVYNIAT